MPGLGKYQCSSCHYVAANRRMLAKHVALVHSDKVYKCPVCPFITQYAANWYRHKRGVHGIDRTTTCDICGFFADSAAELVEHKELDHPECTQQPKKSANETSQAQVREIVITPEVSFIEGEGSILQSDKGVLEADNIDEASYSGKVGNDDSVTFSLPVNGLLDSAEGGSVSATTASVPPESNAMNEINPPPENLRPLKVRRSYNCDDCGLLTNNPREYLYHLINVHGEKLNVYECKYCIYASKHIQKLQRHCKLVHRQQLAKDPDYLKQIEASKERRTKSEANSFSQSRPTNSASANGNFRSFNTNQSNKLPLRNRSNTSMFKCSACSYKTQNKALLFHHEKTAHLKKRFYRCLQCGYVTNEKSRYAKHLKFHDLPKMQCEYCFFKTSYKWNMDRHMRNHEAGAEGEYRCTLCNFTTSTKQSYKSHVTNHHDPNAAELGDQELEMNGENELEWEDVEIIEKNGDESIQVDVETYDFPDEQETPDTTWKESKVYPKNHKCRFCDFRASWPFEIKKHEESHRSQKKHPCPLCGMRFEHIAWLTKHLRRVHREHNQATKIAAAFDLLKPARRRPGKEYAEDTVLPMFQEALKQNVSNNKYAENKSSMLSTLLKKPLQPLASATVNRFSTSYKSRLLNASQSVSSRQSRMSNYYEKGPPEEAAGASGVKTNAVPTCSVCGYKTRWISELQRHMRVHSQEKPFHCHKCKYHCKWKGDLNRHLMKYHGIKVPPSKKHFIPKLKLKKAPTIVEPVTDWQPVNQEKRNQFPSSRPNDQDSPLDLTLTKEAFPCPQPPENIYDAYDFEACQADLNVEPLDVIPLDNVTPPPMNFSPFKPSIPGFRESPIPIDEMSLNGMARKKYQCPFCIFGTTTASRFHVHIVQHYNRRPFMCSVCSYNSNWEWDITKHIRIKGCRDKHHNKACVLLTDESGRRNYEKYEKYLVDIDPPKSPPALPHRVPEMNGFAENETRSNINKPSFNETFNKSCSYDFRNIGSNFEDNQTSQDAPENIIVTPDINIPDQADYMERQDEGFLDKQPDVIENVNVETGNEAKYFYCKHCSFKHFSKRDVISHLSSHIGIKAFRCRACGLSSNWRHVIVKHVKDAHNGYMNQVEDRINYVQEGYALRLTSVNPNNKESDNPVSTQFQQFGCKLCPYKCDKEFYIKFHMKQHRPREGAVYRCDICPYYVKFKKTLVRHMKLHNAPTADDTNMNDNIQPDSNIYNSENQMQNYQNDIYEFDPLQTDSPDDSIVISFDKLNQFSEMEQTSPQKIKRHVCENCPYKTDNKTQYLYHKQFHRPNPTAPFKCSLCTYWATMQHLLTQHMKVHTESDAENESQYQNRRNQRETADRSQDFVENEPPEKIGVIYIKRGDLIVKMFKCQFCPMMNKKKANVRVHQKMHGVIVNNGKFACMYCNYQCLNQGGLTNHIKVHQKVPEKEAFPDEHRKKSSADSGADDSNPYGRKKVFSYFCMKCPAVFKSSSDLQIHKKFHGSALPFPCTSCDYRAKHKPHLFKHMTVHTPEYERKRNASQGPPITPDALDNASADTDTSGLSLVKRIDQMLLIEALEVKDARSRTRELTSLLHKCVFCPAVFIKTSTLSYHTSLHGSDGQYKCSHCDYAVNRAENFAGHVQLHPKKTPVKRTLRTFPCTKCPAVFYKQDRFDRHFGLHGKNSKFVCDQCDYSVRFAANLIKHKALHAAKGKLGTGESLNNTSNSEVVPAASKALTDTTNFADGEEKKIMYTCDRCPYFQTRKDAVQSHQRRHWQKDGFKCPYCDYSSMQNNFLHNHVKLHVQANQLFPAQLFMKFENFKIFCHDDDGKELLLFDDEWVKNGAPDEWVKSDETDEWVKDDEPDENVAEETMEENTEEDENPKNRKARKVIPNYIEDDDDDDDDDDDTDSNSSDTLNKSKVPVVVLSDIFADDENIKKWAPNLKIPKLKISKVTDSSKDRTSEKCHAASSVENSESSGTKKSSKPSLVVKIKVENCVVNMHEKTMYSVKPADTIEEPLNALENDLESTENTNDSASDIIFHNSDPSLHTVASISPVPEDVEECTLTSNPSLDDSMKVAEENVGVEDIMNSIVGTETDTEELIISQPSNEINDVKSDESFSNDTVPVVVGDILCEKLSGLTELPFKDDLSVTNGDCSNHLANQLNLLPGEIKVKL